jgi:hypothetical protein
MSNTNVQIALDKFRKQVVKESKTALTKKKKNASKELYNSISSDLKLSPNSFQMNFYMEDYGKFIDKGVTGKGASDFKGKKKKVHKSDAGYRFGSGNFKGRGAEWEKRIDKWMFSRGIQPRNRTTGKFVKRSTVNFLIRRSIYQHGTEKTLFFTKPFNAAFKSLPDEVVKAYGLDVDKLLKSTT